VKRARVANRVKVDEKHQHTVYAIGGHSKGTTQMRGDKTIAVIGRGDTCSTPGEDGLVASSCSPRRCSSEAWITQRFNDWHDLQELKNALVGADARGRDLPRRVALD
jgi:hypothetical protein